MDMSLTWDRQARTGDRVSSHTLRVRISPGSGLNVRAGLPLQMAIVLDTSGSMRGDKLVRAKQACVSIIELLRSEDRLWLAGFATELNPVIENLPGRSDEARAAVHTLERIAAAGATRTDVALQWLEQCLPATGDAMRVAVLITDGNPTGPRGEVDIDTSPLVRIATRIGDSGTTLCAVGLGNAGYFNTALLTQISDRGRGAFLYADTPERLGELLVNRLSTSQTMITAQAALDIAAIMPGVLIKSACRYRPEYVPLEGVQEGASYHLEVGSLRADAFTDILLAVEVPAPAGEDSWPLEARDVLEVSLVSSTGLAATVLPARAALVNTPSFSEAQKRNDDVEKDRLNWDVNTYSDALAKAQENGPEVNPRRTGRLMASMEQSARRAGNEKLADDVAVQIDHLRQTGKLDAHRATGLLTASRTLGTPASEAVESKGPDLRRTGILTPPSSEAGQE